MPKHCADCEHFGNGRYPVVKYFSDGELRSKFIGFSDRANGEVTEHFAHKCNAVNNILCYDDSMACVHFEPRKWERPLHCRDCSCFKQFYDKNLFTCANYPFNAYHRGSDKACPNGKSDSEKQYTLSDFL